MELAQATPARNACAGPFGGFYDWYITRPRLARLFGALIWGIDVRPLYASIAQLSALRPETVVVDVPCGGGLAFDGFDAARPPRIMAVDIDERMLARARAEAERVGLRSVELIQADMRALPLGDACADVLLSYSGLHMVPDPQTAVGETARCLRPGGRLLGTTFLADGARRQRVLLSATDGRLPRREEVEQWLGNAGFETVVIGPERGFAAFTARRV